MRFADAEALVAQTAGVKWVANVWILGRTVFDTQPFAPLDELAYAKYFDFLDAFIFTARPDLYGSERAQWVRENPERAGEYREWFTETFNREPPGVRAKD